ncbi:histidine kinase [Neobacillus mesonae]|nr:histidine kinase [Neobacillus mesonae]
MDMVIKPAPRKAHPIRHYIKITLLITISALVLDLAISMISISIVKQQSTRYLQDTADLYLTRINHDFNYINHYMGWTLANDDNIEALKSEEKARHYGEFLKANENLRKRYTELQKNYGPEYNFFYYSKEEKLLRNYAPMSISYPKYQELGQQMVSYTSDPNVYEKFYSNWTPILIQDEYYIVNIVPYHEQYLLCLISADDLIAPLRQINLGKNGFSTLVDQDGNILSSPPSDVQQAGGSGFTFPFFSGPRTTVSKAFTDSTINVQMIIEFGAFEKIMVAQLLILLLFVIVACSLIIVVLYFKNRVLKPIQYFSRNLTRLEETSSEPLDFTSSPIVELTQAGLQYRNLIEQIKQIKIDMYEQELSKQQVQLEYMKMQIRPHFFLNCLTNIYSMAQMQMYKEIEYMALSTSSYFRYIFQNDGNFVRLADELEHVKTYLEIQKHRYRNALNYEVIQSEAIQDMTLPPLVLQTFIENAVKYAVSRDNKLQILLRLEHESTNDILALKVVIEDSGPGFPVEILERLRSGLPLERDGGSRIGIMNTLKRLESLYDGDAITEFSNGAHGGACITLILPQASRA